MTGTIHYWRHAPADWPRILSGAREMGFCAIDTYVPWTVHEVEPGQFDWTGRRDAVAFLRLAAAHDLRVTVRPGPACGAELRDHGYPAWVLQRPECQARRSNGTAYILPTATHFIPVPSYGSAAFLAEIDRWYAEVIPRLAPLQAPDGPIVACQVDNEMGFFFQSHPYALDYHPEVIAEYRAFIGDPSAHPPVDGTEEPEARRLGWIRFREAHVRSALDRLAGMLRRHGLDRAVLFHDDYARLETPMDQGSLEAQTAVDIGGVNMYSGRGGVRWVSEMVRHIAGSSRYPWVPELGAGFIGVPWILPSRIEIEDTEAVLLTAILFGARAVNVYMLADRDRWYGGLSDIRGQPRPAARDRLRRIHDLHRRLRLWELRRDAPLLLLENRAESRRLLSKSTLGTLVPAFAGVIPFDFRLAELPEPRRAELAGWDSGLRAAARASGIDWAHATSSAPLPAGHSVIAVPTFECLDRSALDSLSRAEAAGATIVHGPLLPTFDEDMSLLEKAAVPSTWVRIARPSDLAHHLPRAAMRGIDEGADFVRWSSAGREVVALVRHRAEAGEARLEFSGRARFEALFGGDDLEGDGAVEFGVPGYGIRVYEVHR